MDINEFHLMFKKESPIFNSMVLGDIVTKALQDEKVPNSGTQALVEQPVTKKSKGKTKMSTRRSDFIPSAESVLPSYSLVNDSTLRGCIRKPDPSIESNINSLSMESSKSNKLPPKSCVRSSEQACTHAHPISQAGAPEIPIGHSSNLYDSHVQVMTDGAPSSDTNCYFNNTAFSSPHMPYTYTNINDTSKKTTNECFRKNTYNVAANVTEGPAKRSPSRTTLHWQSLTEYPCQQSFSIQKERSSIDQTTARQPSVDRANERQSLLDRAIERQPLLDRAPVGEQFVDPAFVRQPYIDQDPVGEQFVDPAIVKRSVRQPLIDRVRYVERTTVRQLQVTPRQPRIDRATLGKQIVDQTTVGEPFLDRATIRQPLVNRATVREPLIDIATKGEQFVDQATVRQSLVDRVTVGEQPVDGATVRQPCVDQATEGEQLVDRATVRQPLVDRATVIEPLVYQAHMGKQPVDRATVREPLVDQATMGEQPADRATVREPLVDRATSGEPIDVYSQHLQKDVNEPVKKEKKIDENIETCGDEEETPKVKAEKVVTPIAIGKVDDKEMLSIIDALVQAQTCFAHFPQMEKKEDEYVQKEEKVLTHKTPGSAESKTTDIKDQAKDDKQLRMKLVDIMVKYFEQKIVETVRFAKKIPGFLDLTRDDQASLIKASRNESDLISGLKSVNFANQMFTSLDGENFNVEQMKMLFPEESLNLFIEGSRKVEKLKATVEEEAVLRAITLTFSDRCELKCRGKVEDIQNRLVSCLIFILERQPVPLAIRMGQMFDFLLFCRRYSDVELKTMKNLMLDTDKYSSNRIVSEVL